MSTLRDAQIKNTIKDHNFSIFEYGSSTIIQKNPDWLCVFVEKFRGHWVFGKIYISLGFSIFQTCFEGIHIFSGKEELHFSN